MLMWRCSRVAITGSLVSLCLVLPACSQSSTPPPTPAGNSAAEPAMQLPPDQQAYKAAIATVDKDRRAQALQAFLHDFPQSKRAPAAQLSLFKLLLEHQPQNVRKIHQMAQSQIDHANADDRSIEENEIAYDLAEALPNGVDLKSAESWAKDSVAHDTEPATAEMLKRSYAKYKIPPPSAEDIHQYWVVSRANTLQTLADIEFHRGKLKEASATLDEAQALDPTGGVVFGTRGQIAHARGNDSEALEDLEVAETYGIISPAAKPLLLQLYADRHNGDRSGLDAEIDKRYLALPKAVKITPHTAPPTGRTVLVELFTGSACAPCVAADLGLEGALQSYPQSDLVALSFDQHIPEPDPLANADTVARADYTTINGTPTFKIDGLTTEPGYGDRSKGQGTYEALSKAIDTDLAIPSGVDLQLTASLTPAHTIASSAHVEVTDSAALHRLLATKVSPDPLASAATARKTGPPDTASAAADSKLVLNFALVQKEVRYSGENGIRFHSMVVRALARPSAQAFPVAFTGTSTASFVFDPAAVSASLSRYLTAYAHHNDRFGTAHFTMTDTSLPLNDLAVAAWVEDPKTHHVVASALVPLQALTQQAAR